MLNDGCTGSQTIAEYQVGTAVVLVSEARDYYYRIFFVNRSRYRLLEKDRLRREIENEIVFTYCAKNMFTEFRK